MPTLEEKQAEAFHSSDLLPDLFHAVTHHQEIARDDLYDVDSIHEEARAVFGRQITRVAGSNTFSGRIMLIRGDSGSGKTHLMRIFRNQTHKNCEGYFSYMQMTSNVNNFSRYMLRQTLDSLDKVYHESSGPITGLMRLSNTLLETSGTASIKELEDLLTWESDSSSVTRVIFELAEKVVTSTGLRGFEDINLVRALLFLQQRNSARNARVFQYLRCERLSQFDSDALGGLNNVADEDEPLDRLRSLAKLIRTLEGGALVVCLDQLEDLFASEGAELNKEGDRFRNAMRSAIALAEEPNVLVIVACLTDFYSQLSSQLLPSQRDKIQTDPPPVDLKSALPHHLVCKLVAKRMECLYAEAGIEVAYPAVLYPFSEEILAKHSNLRSRDVLSWCREQRSRSEAPPPPPPPPIELERLWNDHHTNYQTPPADQTKRFHLLHEALNGCAAEIEEGSQLAVQVEGSFLNVAVAGQTKERKLLVALCEQAPQGGGLSKRFRELTDAAAGRTPFALRSSEFPSNPKAQIAKQIGEFISAGGKRAQLTESDWRAIHALPSFRTQYGAQHGFDAWLRQSHPMSRLDAIREILSLEGAPLRPATTQTPNAGNTAHTPKTENTPQGKVRIGVKIGMLEEPYFNEQADFTRHAAFLGGTGSGKTTLSLNIIEQLLMAGVNALLIDRKGDLCCYGHKPAWESNGNQTRQSGRQAFTEAVDIAIYTPGTAAGVGRPLSIGIAPNSLNLVPSTEREQLANLSATALGGLMNYGNTPTDEPRVAILGRAIALLAEQNLPISIESLLHLISSEDPLLVNAIGRLDPKHFRNIVERLQTLQFRRGLLFEPKNELLSAESLFAPPPGKKARLSVINTSFLQDASTYWVAQLLLEIGRYAVRNPRKALQAVVLFDEADMYLPAQSKPATKQPMESLLRRARSAGLGIMLATQSPGDLDYKSRDQIASWYVGKIKESVSIKKLEPLFQDAKIDPSPRLASQQTGQFFVMKEREILQIKSDLSLMVTQQLAQEDILAAAQLTIPRKG